MTGCLTFAASPLADETCLRCHVVQGYDVGDIPGGITINVPMPPFPDNA